MNILVVHETEYINKVIFEYQIIPELWASQGHKVYVLDYPLWRRNHILDFGTLRTEYKKQVKKANKKSGVTLIRPGIIKIPVISRTIAFMEYFFLIPQILRRYKINVIFLYAVPTNGLQTLFWAKRFKIPVHFRLLDVLHQLVPAKILTAPTRWMEKIVYSHVDELSAITPRLQKYAIFLGANPKTSFYLPSGADSALFYPRRKPQSLMRQLKISKRDKIILFAGTLYNFSGLDIILKYFRQHKQRYRNLKFIIAGHGEQKTQLLNIINQYHIANRVTMTGFVDYSKLADYIRLADVCINPFIINKTTNLIFPGKIYQYLACGKPVIATRLQGMIDIFPKSNGKNEIYYFNYRRPKELFDLVNKISHQKIQNPNPNLQKISLQLANKLVHLSEDNTMSAKEKLIPKRRYYQIFIEVIFILWVIVSLSAWWSIKVASTVNRKYMPYELKIITKQFNNWVKPIIQRQSIYQENKKNKSR